MSKNTFCWKHDRPLLVIERTGGGAIATNYSGDTWRITSTYPLKKEKIEALYKLGLVGFGQEFGILSQCDGNELPAGHDLVQCVEITPKGEVLPGVATNPYSGKPYEPKLLPYYEYNCWSKCDSGD
jgi:hypothetical protein